MEKCCYHIKSPSLLWTLCLQSYLYFFIKLPSDCSCKHTNSCLLLALVAKVVPQVVRICRKEFGHEHVRTYLGSFWVKKRSEIRLLLVVNVAFQTPGRGAPRNWPIRKGQADWEGGNQETGAKTDFFRLMLNWGATESKLNQELFNCKSCSIKIFS